MRFFRKRITPSENLSFIAIAVAMDAVLSLIATFLPLSDIFIILVLPLISALTMVLIDKKYILVYLFSSLICVSLVTCYDLRETLFYVYPSILTGILYGILVKFKTPVSLLIFFSSLLSLGFNYLSIPLIKAIYSVDMISFIKGVFGLTDYLYVDDIIPTFLFGISLAGISITHFFISMVFSEFKVSYGNEGIFSVVSPIASIFFSFLAILLGFYYVPVAYLFYAFALYFSVFASLNLLSFHRWYLMVLLVVLLIGSIYSFAIFNSSFPKDSPLLLSSLFFVSVSIPSLLSVFLLKKEGLTLK